MAEGNFEVSSIALRGQRCGTRQGLTATFSLIYFKMAFSITSCRTTFTIRRTVDGCGSGRWGGGGRVGRAMSRVCKSGYMDCEVAPTQLDYNQLQPYFWLQSVGLLKGCICGRIACLMPKGTSKDRLGPAATGSQTWLFTSCFPWAYTYFLVDPFWPRHVRRW